MNKQSKTVQLEDERRVEKEYQKVLGSGPRYWRKSRALSRVIVGRRLPLEARVRRHYRRQGRSHRAGRTTSWVGN